MLRSEPIRKRSLRRGKVKMAIKFGDFWKTTNVNTATGVATSVASSTAAGAFELARAGQNVQNFFIENAQSVTIIQSPDLEARMAVLEQQLKDWKTTATEAGIPQGELTRADQELETSLSTSFTAEQKFEQFANHTGKVVKIINSALSAADKLKDWF